MSIGPHVARRSIRLVERRGRTSARTKRGEAARLLGKR